MHKKLIAVFVAVMALVSSVSMAKENAPTSVDGAKTVDISVVLEMMEEKEDLVVIDARKDADFNAGHIDGAIKLTNSDVTEESLAAVLADKATPVVFYCNGPKCGRSSDAASKAVAAGYSNVYYFYGGIAAWKEEGLPLAQ